MRYIVLTAGWLTLCLAVWSMTPHVFAGDGIELIINDVPEYPTPIDLFEAVDASNAAALSGGGATTIEIRIGSSILVSSGAPGTVDPLYLLHGTGNPANPTEGPGGFKRVSITGAGSRSSIGFTADAIGRNPVLEIINVGESIAIDALTITGGNLTYDASDPYRYLGGGGMYLGAASGQTKYLGAQSGIFADTITVSNTIVASNTVASSVDNKGGNEMVAAIGGGAFIDATYYADLSWEWYDQAGGTVVFEDVTFMDNAVSVGSSTKNGGTGSSSFGGGVHIKNAARFTYSGGEVTNNRATTTNGSHAAGGGIVIDDFTHQAALSGLTVGGNIVTAEGRGLPDGDITKALGGGLYTYHDGTAHGMVGTVTNDHLILTVSTVTFSGNRAVGKGANVDAYGGGAYLNINTLATFTGGTFSRNDATSENGAAWGGGLAQTAGDRDLTVTGTTFSENKATGATDAFGGGAFSQGRLVVNDVEFSKNTATGGHARGGGLYTAAGAAIAGTDFVDNRVVGDTTGRGGALYAADSANPVTVTGATISGNKVTSARSEGGGIYSEGVISLIDVAVTGNAASDDTGVGAALGGGIYMSTGFSSGGVLNLAATTGNVTVIRGNLAGGKASGIHFGADGNSQTDGVLNIHGDGTVTLSDPLSVAMRGAGKAFTLNRSGTGRFEWGGVNTLGAEAGSTLNLDAGVTRLLDDFTATAASGTALAVHLGGAFGFDSLRDAATAMFTYDGSHAGNALSFAGDTLLNIDMTSELFDTTRTYLLADNYNGDTSFAGNVYGSDRPNVTSTVTVDGDKVYVTAVYETLYGDVLAHADPNTRSAIDSGTLPEWFRHLTAAERAALTESSMAFNNATPGWFMNNLFVARETLIAGATGAIRYGLRQTFPASLPVSSAGARADGALASIGTTGACGFRFWTGYIGDFDRMDGHGGYHGFRSDRHGVLAGVNYDAAEVGSIGVYAGYSHTATKAGGVTARVTSDTGHVGLIGRLSPFREAPAFSVYADVGHTFGSDDSERGTGILRTTGDMKTRFYTAGLELEYAARFGRASLTPFASGRYVRLKQDAVTERGPLAGGIGDVADDAFMTRIGAAAGYDFVRGSVTVTPSVTVAWRHDFGGRQYSANAFLPVAGNPSYFQVRSASFDRDSVDIGAALQASLATSNGRRIDLNAGYNLNTSGNRDNHSIFAGCSFLF